MDREWNPEKMRKVLAREEIKYQELQNKEKKIGTDEFPWGIYGVKEGPLSYIESFRELMGENFTNFDDWIKKRKEEKGGHVSVVDYFGPADAVDSSINAPADSVLAVLLSDLRATEQKLREPKKTVLELNLYDPDPENWRRIKEYKDEHCASGFDLSFFRPLKATVHSDVENQKEEYLRLYYKILQNAYELMSREHGVLLFQVPIITSNFDDVISDAIDAWQEKLKKQGIMLVQAPWRYFLKLIKTPNAPKKLPVFSLEELLDAGEERKTLDDRLSLKGP